MKNKLIERLNNNEVIGHTTDTVIGLMAKVNKDNIFKINQLKERPIDQPLQLLISDYNQVKDIVEDIDKLKEIEQPETSYILKVKPQFNHDAILPSFHNTIMIRKIHGELKEIIDETGPLFATSANKHNRDVLESWEKVEETFGVLTNRSNTTNKKPSKIISLVDGEVKTIRE